MLRRQRSSIAATAEANEFYIHFQRRFIAISVASRIITSGLVSRAQDAFEKNAQIVCKVVDAVPVVNNIARVAQATMTIGAKLVNMGHSTASGDRYKNVSNFVTSFTAVDELAEEIGRLAALRYHEQIRQLTITGAQQLAESAVERVYEAIANEKVEEPSAAALLDCIFLAPVLDSSIFGKDKKNVETKIAYSEDGFWNDDGILSRTGIVTPEGRLYENAYRSNIKDVLKDSSLLSKGWNETKKFMNSSVSIVQRDSIHGIKNAHNTVTSTFNKIRDDSIRLWSRTGLVKEISSEITKESCVEQELCDENNQESEHKRKNYSKLCNHPHKYGYRLGTVEEAEALKLIDLPQTEEQMAKMRQRYYISMNAYDYEAQSFSATADDEIEMLKNEIAEMKKLFTTSIEKMQKLIEEQKQEIDMLHAYVSQQHNGQ